MDFPLDDRGDFGDSRSCPLREFPALAGRFSPSPRRAVLFLGLVILLRGLQNARSESHRSLKSCPRFWLSSRLRPQKVDSGGKRGRPSVGMKVTPLCDLRLAPELRGGKGRGVVALLVGKTKRRAHAWLIVQARRCRYWSAFSWQCSRTRLSHVVRRRADRLQAHQSARHPDLRPLTARAEPARILASKARTPEIAPNSSFVRPSFAVMTPLWTARCRQ